MLTTAASCYTQNSYKKIILSQEPDFFIFENVKGLWSTKKHRLEYDKLKQSLSRKGYVFVDRLVNAIEYSCLSEILLPWNMHRRPAKMPQHQQGELSLQICAVSRFHAGCYHFCKHVNVYSSFSPLNKGQDGFDTALTFLMHDFSCL